MAVILGATGVGIPVALPIMLVGSVVSAYFLYVATSYPGDLITGDVSQIELANVDSDLKNEINQKYTEIDSDFTTIDTNTFPLWKLDFGAYEKVGNTAEVDPESINVISLSYQTDGEIYTLESDTIRTNANVDDYLDPNNNSTPLNPYPTEPSDGFNINILYYVIGAIGAYYILFKEIKLHKKPGLFILLILAVYYLLSTFGVI